MSTTIDTSSEEILGPRKVEGISVILASIGAIVAGFVGGLFTLVGAYFLFNRVDSTTMGMSGYFLSLIGFFSVLVTAYISLFMNRVIFGDKYHEGLTTFNQISVFSIFVYILITPLYLYVASLEHSEYLAYVYLLHILVNSFGTSMIAEVLANYRYVLLGIYGAFIGFLVSLSITFIFTMTMSGSSVKFFILAGAFIVVNFVTTFSRVLFEYGYYTIYSVTGNDQLGDIFARIEAEEREMVAEAEERLGKFEKKR